VKRLAAYAVVLLIVGALAWWFFSNHELRQETRRVGPSAAARQNPLLAVERFFRQVGMATSTHQTLVALPPTDQTLILVAPRRYLGYRRSDQLLDWVRDGGHLIISPQRRDRWSDEEDFLLQEVGISANFADADEDQELRGYRAPTPSSPAREAHSTGRFDAVFPGTDQRLAMARYSRVMLVDEAGEASFTVNDDLDRAHILHRQLGRGFVTVIAERAFLTNWMIGQLDHAQVAWQLIHLGLRPAGVWIVLSDDMPGIVTLLVRNAWPALIAGLLLLVLWLWSVGARFGPRDPEPEPTRRSLREHLEAAGTFLWRQRASGALLAAVRQRLRTRLLIRQPELARATLEEAVAGLALLSGIPADRLRAALLPETIADPRVFTQAVRDLQTLLKKL